MSILTPQRLVELSTSPHLENSWYFITASALAICNKPEEIPKVFHMGLMKNHNVKSAELATQTSEQITKASLIGPAPEKIEDLTNKDNLVDKKDQLVVAQKIREALLKGAALGGLPRSINALTVLKNSTPNDLKVNEKIRNPHEEFSTGKEFEQDQKRGLEFWDKVYGKVSKRVKKHLESAYPDLLDYALNHVYGPLLSYTGILNGKESSLVVISCLVPQNVNPQLKGHLKGAQNNGASLEEIRAARVLAINIADWCGVELKEPVAKL